MAHPIVPNTEYIRDLTEFRNIIIKLDDGGTLGLCSGLAVALDDGTYYVVRCPFCRAAYGVKMANGYAGSAVDFCENCGKMQPI